MERIEFMEIFQGSSRGEQLAGFHHEGHEVCEGFSRGLSRGWEAFISFKNSMVENLRTIP
jgi:hypothetical protein